MDKLPIKNGFKDKTNTAANRRKIKLALEKNPLVVSELIGVFVNNAQSVQLDQNLYDAPIPIDLFDQARLHSLRLATPIKTFTPEEFIVPTDVVTDLGMYIVQNTIVIGEDDDKESLPRIDSSQLLKLVS